MRRVIYTPMTEKYFKKLKDKPFKNAFKEAVINIRENPYIGEAKTGDMIVIILVGTRENFYTYLIPVFINYPYRGGALDLSLAKIWIKLKMDLPNITYSYL